MPVAGAAGAAAAVLAARRDDVYHTRHLVPRAEAGLLPPVAVGRGRRAVAVGALPGGDLDHPVVLVLRAERGPLAPALVPEGRPPWAARVLAAVAAGRGRQRGGEGYRVCRRGDARGAGGGREGGKPPRGGVRCPVPLPGLRGGVPRRGREPFAAHAGDGGRRRRGHHFPHALQAAGALPKILFQGFHRGKSLRQGAMAAAAAARTPAASAPATTSAANRHRAEPRPHLSPPRVAEGAAAPTTAAAADARGLMRVHAVRSLPAPGPSWVSKVLVACAVVVVVVVAGGPGRKGGGQSRRCDRRRLCRRRPNATAAAAAIPGGAALAREGPGSRLSLGCRAHPTTPGGGGELRRVVREHRDDPVSDFCAVHDGVFRRGIRSRPRPPPAGAAFERDGSSSAARTSCRTSQGGKGGGKGLGG